MLTVYIQHLLNEVSMCYRKRVWPERRACVRQEENVIQHVKHVWFQNFSMFCIKIFFIMETRSEQRNTRVDYTNCKTDTIIFPFILVLFSFITDFYFCQTLMVPFKIFFAKTFWYYSIVHLKVVSKPQAIELCTGQPRGICRKQSIKPIALPWTLCIIICQPKPAGFLCTSSSSSSSF